MSSTTDVAVQPTFADDVGRDLAREPKELQSKYFYDALGSQLFEAICRLPWYRITEAESSLLRRCADDVIAALPPTATITELGPGSGEKLVVLAEALQRAGRSARVHLVDVSAAALEQSERSLGPLDQVSVIGHESTYEVGLARVSTDRASGEAMLTLFLGSSIGNFGQTAARDFLMVARRVMRPGDLMLLGTDLVKPEPVLRDAYDDPLGVTAAFNKNLLVRINRVLDGHFDLAHFEHLVVWNAGQERIELYLRSTRAQTVRIGAIDREIVLAEGETICTEHSHKYRAERIAAMGEAARFVQRHQWIESEAQFALTLFEAT
ncbi:MAG: L-histidine N(alpha)-methyltransferase [Vicinamibacterales bacterium]|mgnify:CR=1 FL=1|nr:L-histidine N(alpha)-methyltransferase [Acidobacteriota bacterium]MDP6374208.1 L-histidine N(alpha)-methyltransferase [Vicinamibacterales bacterium]MDP6610070.1 L-histidine N(alpha)-methyltransferase [Vicinamibacterales bacterium]HAK56225.1 L-histidine N(alpha)-methyltransferase [Acidobacteriota bacterium]